MKGGPEKGRDGEAGDLVVGAFGASMKGGPEKGRDDQRGRADGDVVRPR